MRIIILGAGHVGELLARNLVGENNDIVLVDLNAELLSDIKAHLDIQTITGNAAHPDVLLDAGIEKTDVLIAVTPDDEVNILACLIANKLFQMPRTIARIRSQNYHRCPAMFKNNIIPIQTIIYPTGAIIQHISRMIKYPDFNQIFSFCNDAVCLISVDIQQNEWSFGKTIAEIHRKLAKTHAAIVAIFNKKQAIQLVDNYTIELRDKIVFIAMEKNLFALLKSLERHPKKNHRIMIAGGGRIGNGLAKQLEDDYQIKLIEKSTDQVTEDASQLNKTLVIEGDISDRDLLVSENIEDVDVFCAVTNDDEANIMGSLQAKYLGAKYAMTLVNRENYFDLIDDSVIDSALSPQSITIGTILSKIRHGNVAKIPHLQDEEVEAVELLIAGTEQTSAVIGRAISDIELPPGCIVAGIFRGKKLHFVTSNLVIAAKDRVILLVLKKKYLHQVEALFEVNLTFMS